jgi:pyruvate, orthophosphate dikinase
MLPQQTNSDKTWTYLFEECDETTTKTPKLLFGGKGAALVEMTSFGLPVPPGFIVTTDCCKAYHEGEKLFPKGLWQEVMNKLYGVETKSGKKFGALQILY